MNKFNISENDTAKLTKKLFFYFNEKSTVDTGAAVILKTNNAAE